MKYGNWGALQRHTGLWVPSRGLKQAPQLPRWSPAPLKTWATFPGAACRGLVRVRCQLVSARSLAELAAGIIKLQTVFRPGVPLQGETARSSACQQLIRATPTPATRLHPRAIQTTHPHTSNNTDGPPGTTPRA